MTFNKDWGYSGSRLIARGPQKFLLFASIQINEPQYEKEESIQRNFLLWQNLNKKFTLCRDLITLLMCPILSVHRCFIVSSTCKWEGGASIYISKCPPGGTADLSPLSFFHLHLSPPFFWGVRRMVLSLFILSPSVLLFPSQLNSLSLNSDYVNILHIQRQSRDAILALISPSTGLC